MTIAGVSVCGAVSMRVAGVALLAASLSACAGANRFDGFAAPRAPTGPVYQTPPAQQGGFQPVGPAMGAPAGPAQVNSGPVTAQPLPPPGEQLPAAPPAPSTAGTTLPGATPTVAPDFSRSEPGPAPAGGLGEMPTISGGATRVVTLGERSQGGGRGPVSSRDGIVGGWTAREATGGACKVQLSSSPALDLYRASASGCANKDLQKVTAWDYRNGEVYLYQPGGAVAARMRVNDGSSISGAMARSGAGLTLSR